MTSRRPRRGWTGGASSSPGEARKQYLVQMAGWSCWRAWSASSMTPTWSRCAGSVRRVATSRPGVSTGTPATYSSPRAVALPRAAHQLLDHQAVVLERAAEVVYRGLLDQADRQADRGTRLLHGGAAQAVTSYHHDTGQKPPAMTLALHPPLLKRIARRAGGFCCLEPAFRTGHSWALTPWEAALARALCCKQRLT